MIIRTGKYIGYVLQNRNTGLFYTPEGWKDMPHIFRKRIEYRDIKEKEKTQVLLVRLIPDMGQRVR